MRKADSVDVRIVEWWPGKRSSEIDAFFERGVFDGEVEEAVAKILGDVRRDGNRAVTRYARLFDGVRLRPSQFLVRDSEIRLAVRQVDRATRRGVKEARDRVACFARAAMRGEWRVRTREGGWLGERFAPLDRVGVYIPGGAAPLASTVVMTVTLARVAGVREIVACTPCDRHGRVNPVVLFALRLCGATEVYRVGGAHAIAMLAYGTETIRKVQKIVGPGGPFVTAAKRQVYGHVAIDLPAGPSEIAVLADESADPVVVTADLLSQVEHGTGWERALLVATSPGLALRVRDELQKRVRLLKRKEAVERVLARKGILLVVVRSAAEGLELCNRFAPEHLELMIRRPSLWSRKARCAGAVFIGRWTPEAAGDFAAGPSHVLPTGGTACMFSGLTVDDFRRRTSVIAYSRRDLERAMSIIQTFGRVEGLDGHVESAFVRFRKSQAR
ncbi:MAG: histidinol dehydrogenase [Kiritimatiellae bacterium]|nr:histidinol dehydrogenase [Kiritimatiellia bacterium]